MLQIVDDETDDLENVVLLAEVINGMLDDDDEVDNDGMLYVHDDADDVDDEEIDELVEDCLDVMQLIIDDDEVDDDVVRLVDFDANE